MSNPSQIEDSPIESSTVDLTNDETLSVSTGQPEHRGSIVEETATSLSQRVPTSSDSAFENKHWLDEATCAIVLERDLNKKNVLFRHNVAVGNEVNQNTSIIMLKIEARTPLKARPRS